MKRTETGEMKQIGHIQAKRNEPWKEIRSNQQTALGQREGGI